MVSMPASAARRRTMYQTSVRDIAPCPSFLVLPIAARNSGPILTVKNLEGSAAPTRNGAEGWEEILLPEIDRQQAQGKEVAFRGDAAFAKRSSSVVSH
jgi:hypothetical protein